MGMASGTSLADALCPFSLGFGSVATFHLFLFYMGVEVTFWLMPTPHWHLHFAT